MSTEYMDDQRAPAQAVKPGEYIVVARRYRPRGFDELVGQSLVCQALTSAIKTDRVGHAYLFTGARGVGKTSTARILSKALNCVEGPTSTPCDRCDVCLGIASGDDVDVLEIDGASNRGIDEIRQLRSNIGVRPSRARFKIYIIDEVHMLTKEAFNALLKTLEEPPEHVKFIFCTTAPEKIPITVLSRCQRFDFSPIETPAIVERLQKIVTSEGAEADTEALELLARKAAGSMRDSQSLLEQLLAFAGDRITVANVHRMLGTADSVRLHRVVAALADRNAAATLQELDAAIGEGVDAGQFAEQLLACLRDTMAVLVGCDASLLLYTPAHEYEQAREFGRRWGMETLLAAAQILDQSIVRMRQSTHGRILLETALIRIARLEHLDALPELITQLRAGVVPITESRQDQGGEAERHVHGAAQPAKKKIAAPPASVASDASPGGLTPAAAEALWKTSLEGLDDMTADCAAHYSCVATFAPNRVVVMFSAMYNSSKSFCERPERREKLEEAVSAAAGHKIQLEFAVLREDSAHVTPAKPKLSAHQLREEAGFHPFVRQAIELFSAEVISIVPARSALSH